MEMEMGSDRNGADITIMTIYHLASFDDPRESILIPFPVDTLPSIVTVTFSQEATEETEI